MGGDRPSPPLSPITIVAGVSGALKLPISPLVGEMSGRTGGREGSPLSDFSPRRHLTQKARPSCPWAVSPRRRARHG
ncbi:MAG: hypothetical protein E5W70_18445 [Mesorhizobium sp.]|nr:MAG: hypothetical protein E5W70_18445 [Mesorhizobium sp.]